MRSDSERLNDPEWWFDDGYSGGKECSGNKIENQYFEELIKKVEEMRKQETK